MPDKYSATWVSHSSISDYIECPRAYYLKNVYKDPNTSHKISIITPALTLGQTVHEQLEALSVLPVGERMLENLVPEFLKKWENVRGEKGGFIDEKQEHLYRQRGEDMLRRVLNNPGPFKKKAVKIQKDLLNYWLSEEEEIILCGKIDWMEYLEDEDAVHIIDFKTGQHKQEGSLQLPIYYLLATNSQKRVVNQMSYWYIALDDELTNQELPDPEKAYQEVISIARKIKLARQLQKFDCPKHTCRQCEPFERILKGEGKLIGVDDFRRDVYVLPDKDDDETNEVIL
jgi:ATP-dependent helicase/DNAse subunit B